MSVLRTAALLLALSLAACNTQGPSLAGQPGLQWQVVSFYGDRAMERAASCPNPRMSITRYRVVEETPEQVVMDIDYYWVDECRR